MFYAQHLRGAAARRIAALRDLSSMLGLDGVLEVEMCPFHSATLSKKRQLLAAIDAGGFLAEYLQDVRSFLDGRPAVAVSAVSTHGSLLRESTLSPWATRLAKVASLDQATAEFVPLTLKGSRITSAALISHGRGCPRALVLMMGGNNFPAIDGLHTLAGALRATGEKTDAKDKRGPRNDREGAATP